MAISAFCFDFIERLHHAQATDPALVAFHDEIHAGTRTAPWALVDGMVAIEDRLYIPPTSPLLQEILAAVHNDGHEGIHRTLHRLRQDFHFPNMRRLVQDFVKACVTYQQYKSNYLRLAGLLQPLPIPPAIWADIGIDFIEALPKVQRQDGHPLRRGSLQQILPFHPLSAPLHRRVRRARLLRQHRWTTWRPAVHRLEPRSGVHSTFWQELMQLTGTKLYMSTAFHPQTDGQTEAANRVIIMYLRSFTDGRPRQWLRWLPWAEYTYNTAFQSSLRDMPFCVVYGRDPDHSLLRARGDPCRCGRLGDG